MKLAVITQYFPTSRQPWAGHSAYQTLRFLAQQCDLHVFFPQAFYPRRFSPASSLGAPLDRTWQPADVRVTYVPYPVLPVISRPFNGFTIASRLLTEVRGFYPDVILNYVVYPDGFAAVRIARALKVPVVLTAIGSDLNRISDPLCGMLTRATLRRADYVTTVSHDLRKTAIALGSSADRTRAILNGCDLAIFHPGDRRKAREALGLDHAAEVIVYVGRLDVRKGLLELIEATAQLRVRRPALQCFLVGDGPDRPTLLSQIASHEAAGFVTLIPSCPTAGVAQWMAACDLVTLPSYREGCPNVVIEALAAGRPVVATNVGGIPELMSDADGRLIAPKSVSALTRALDEVLAETWDAEALSQKHSRSWEDVAHDLFQVLEGQDRRAG